MEKLFSLLRFESILALLIIATLFFLYYAEIEPINQRINGLSQQLKEIEFYKGDTLLVPNAAYQELNKRIDSLENNFEQKQSILMKFTPLSITALLLLFWAVYKVALNFAVEEAKKDVARSYMNEETLFLNEKKILVLTKEGGSTEFVQRFFNKSNFKNHKIEPPSATLPDSPDNKYDMFFINNENEDQDFTFDEGEIKKFMDKCKAGKIIFNFGKHVSDVSITKNERFTSATFRSQLLGNLMNAFRYQKVLK